MFKASWSRRLYSLWSYVFRRRLQYLQDVLIKTNILALAIGFKIFSRRLKCVLQKRPPSRHPAKTFSRRLQKHFKVSCRDIFKMHHQVKLFLLTSLQDVFKTFQDVSNVLSRGEDLPRPHFWEIYGKGTKFSFWIYIFLKHFLKWLLLQIKIFLLKLGIRKDVAISVNKESMNKRISKTCLRF